MTDDGAAVCRFCGGRLRANFVDLGMSPLCESFVPRERLNEMERFYPLHVYVCESCLLVQLEEYVSPEAIFRDYAYFSSYSTSWLEHSKRHVDTMVHRLRLGRDARVVEVASNDGYLLQYFLPHGIVPLGIEPAANVAKEAEAKGVPTLVEFFTADLARHLVRERGPADLIIGNNVLAQVPGLRDFVEGLSVLLGPTGVATLEFPHLLRLIDENQFDTIYHEHFSYFSLLAVERIFAAFDLQLYDVEELPTHGGSLRVYLRHAGENATEISPRVGALRECELQSGLGEVRGYAGFSPRVEGTKRKLLRFLIDAKEQGKSIAGYGAPGKGNTLLNYCGIRTDFLDYTVDRNPHKWGMYLPGTHIPVFAPERLDETKPDYILILPWNLKQEIMAQLEYVRGWGGRFVVPIPEVQLI
ncbi:MAG: methyltransferase domain-containing protein [Thermoleophilia bacterium]|nr:methyltransferase domain-containing protein [Thermoleophilia bacterium]